MQLDCHPTTNHPNRIKIAAGGFTTSRRGGDCKAACFNWVADAFRPLLVKSGHTWLAWLNINSEQLYEKLFLITLSPHVDFFGVAGTIKFYNLLRITVGGVSICQINLNLLFVPLNPLGLKS